MQLIQPNDLRELLMAQASLNVKYTGEQWSDVVPISHFLCAMMAEYGELLESSPRTGDNAEGWKWWKPYLENDVNNNKVEAVDMIHFAMSALLIRFGGVEAIMETYDLIEDANTQGFEKTPSIILLGAVNAFSIDVAFNEDPKPSVGAFTYLIDALCSYAEMTPDEMVELYFKKNKLNQNRIEGGYTKSADSYEKYDKDGNEDNTLMFAAATVAGDDSNESSSSSSSSSESSFSSFSSSSDCCSC